MDIRELIPLHALGLLGAAEASAVEQALASSPELAAELDAFRDTAHALAAVAAPAAFPTGTAGPAIPRPSPDVRTRLLASVGGGRFDAFAERLTRLYDVAIDRARELLGVIESNAQWERSAPGIDLVHFAGGPACATADCGFVRIAPGATFPLHVHLGEEVMVVLAGRMRDDSGQSYSAGDELVRAIGSQHSLMNVGDDDVLFAARANGGIDVTAR